MNSTARVMVVLAMILASTTHAETPDHSDLEYAKVGDRSLYLDLYLPKSTDPTGCPLVVWVHGGAWRAGSKSDVPVTRWLRHGFAIASVDYRLSGEARFPAQVHDIKAAIRYMRSNANDYGIDSNRIVIAGASAGGHLAALVGVSGGVRELEGALGEYPGVDSHVNAIVSFYGASNLQSILGQSTEHGLNVRVPALKLLLGGLPEQASELAELASPVAHIDSHDPPLWLIHGDADPQMPFEQSVELEAAYRDQGLFVDLDVVRQGKHGGPDFYTDQRLDQLASQLAERLFK